MTHDVVVVGAGQAGVSVSHYLQERGVDHLLLERDRAFSAWRQRWDGFRANTPNWMNTLPVLPDGRFPSDDPRAFATREEMVAYLDDCLSAVDPPLALGVEVERVTRLDDGFWEVSTNHDTYRARCVVICNGAMLKPRIPEASSLLLDSVPQLHSSEYMSPAQVETGSVLVVGSASSGVQICRLLCESARFDQVHMAVSKVMVLPRHVLGVPTHRLVHALGLFDVTTTSRIGRLMYSGLETRGDPIQRPTPRDLARIHGVALHPRLTGVVDGSLIRFADGQTMGTEDLTVIWCTGFQGDYDFLSGDGELLDQRGVPRHTRGVADGAPGLFFVGLRYQHTVASHDIYGVARDAEFVAEKVHAALLGREGQIEVQMDESHGAGR